MADRIDRITLSDTGTIDNHPDFPEFLQSAQEQVWGEYAPRLERAVASGNTAAAERVQAQADQEARRRAVVAARSMLNSGATGLHRPASEELPSADSLMQGIRGMDAGSAAGQLGPIDYGQPMAGTRPMMEALPDVIPESERGFYREPERPTTGIALGPQSSQEAFELSRQGQDLGFAAETAAPFAAGPVFGGLAQGANALGRAVAQSPVGQAVGRAATAVGEHVARNAPRYGLAGAAGGTLATTATPQDIPAPSAEDRATLQSLQTELGKWQDQLKTLQAQRKQAADAMEAQQRGTGGAKPGYGPIFQAQQKSLEGLDEQIRAINKSIEGTNTGITQVRNRMSPEYRLQIQRQQEKAARDEQERRARTPFRELASDFMPYVPWASAVAAIVMGGALKGQAITSWNGRLSTIDQRWQQSVQRAQTAAPNSNAYRQAVTEAEQHMKQFEELFRRGDRGTRRAMVAGGGLGFAQATFPEDVDLARAVIGSPLWDSLKKEVFADLPTFGTYAGRAGISTLLGATLGLIGAEGREAFFNVPETPVGYGPQTRGMLSPPQGQRPQAPIPPNNQPVPPGGGRGGPQQQGPAGPQGGISVEELLRRRRREGPIDGGHWVDPDGPPTPREAWASPKGQKMWMRDEDGHFRDESGDLVRDSRGKLVTDPRRSRPGWRRLSFQDRIELFGGYPVG